MFSIRGREISPDQPPYIVAEVSCNHAGNLEYALELIGIAKRASADAVKFQAYTADTMTIDCDNDDFIMQDGLWKGQNLYDLYKRSQTPFEWFPELFAEAERQEITLFASVFDNTSVDMLENLECPAYKIASFEVGDTNLIRRVVETGKPMIVSTGMATGHDILRIKALTDNLIFLDCVSEYPTRINNGALHRRDSAELFGISDHSLGHEIAIAAVAMGACVIEKHLMIGSGIVTADADFSMLPFQFKEMCDKVRGVWEAIHASKSMSAMRQAMRSLYAVADIEKGESLTHENVRSIRPGYGLPPSRLDHVTQCIAAVDIKRGTPLSYDIIERPIVDEGEV